MDQEEEYTIPLEDQRVFGAGIKRKRVHFVPAATETLHLAPQLPATKNAGLRYLSIVLDDVESKKEDKADKKATLDAATGLTLEPTSSEGARCAICNLPVTSITHPSTGDTKPHETSLVHQVCLAHSHPPSHLDRDRAGMKYLSSYGWDPDSRLGLGAKGEGIRVPVKAEVKNDTVGLGVERAISKGLPVSKEVERLDAKAMKRREIQSNKKAARLRQMFYGSDDVEKYLGSEE